MKTKVIETGEWERDLEVEVPADRIDAEVATAVKKYRKRLEIPGFRKGKVPTSIVEARYGESIRQSVIGDLLPQLMQEAAREAGLVPAATPKITKLEHEPGQPLSFTATLEIWPEVEIVNAEGLKVTQLTHEVSDEEIDERLKELQNHHATERSIDRPLEKGDVLIADLQRVDEAGIPIVGDKFEERYFIIGDENAPSPEFEEALLGIRAGEERRVQFSYREDLEDRELAGQTERFAVSAREVRERTLPALDDEFARDMGDEFESLQAVRDHLRSQIEERWRYLSRQSVRGELMDGLIRANNFDLPGSLVDNYIETTRRERQEARQQQGAGHDHDHDHDHDDEEEAGEQERSHAVRRLKTYLLMEAMRKKLALDIGDEEFEEYLGKRAGELGMKAADLKRSPRLDDLRRELEDDKVLEYLKDQADIEEKAV